MTAAAAVAAGAPATQRVVTRLATLDDVAFLKPIISTGYAGNRNWTNQSAIIQDERVTIDELHAIVKRGTDPIVVAEVDGQVVGCIQIEFCRDHPELRLPDDAALLGMLAVHHEYESMGIGSMLGRAAFAVAAHNNCHRAMLLLVNKRTDLQATYERKGFRFTGETRPFTFGGRVLQDDVHFLVYELALTPTQ